ncbi:uncharacterized protein LOC126884691 [Diabrotica virgifera virgifera]|uniref:Helix-turn-helix domain-containing protein n=1 Tax=Diabrotica virgifera virgifera TaxID=50390 RepID=A0ABM5K955_DIAVI|nr:uncharacterized protein LOC126884691 [Diabrotica virgifera virgifera]
MIFLICYSLSVEEESNSSVPFLDTLVVRTDSNLICLDWYRKNTNSGRFIPYNSYHPEKQKINVVLAMKNRITNICHPKFVDKNVKILYDTLLSNQYPKKLLNKLLFSNHIVNNDANRSVDQVDIPVRYGKLPFLQNLTRSLIGLFSGFNIKIATYNLKTLNLFYSRLKDPTPTLQRCNVVYGIPCECGLVYIGQTGQRLNKRLSLHKSDCKLKPQSTSLSIHVNSKDHRVLYNDAFILDVSDKDFQRKILEMCYIYNAKNSINHKKDVDNLSTIYTFLLKQNISGTKKLPAIYVSDIV